MNAEKIARRILSRARRMSFAYASGPLRQSDGSWMTKILVDGYEYRAKVRPLTAPHARPKGFDHIVEQRRHSDQYRLAVAFAKSAAELKDVDDALSDLDVWHKDGVAGFVLIGQHGERQLVEISEHTFDMQLAEAEAFVAASREAA
jgi:hypothetical protein